VRRGGLPPSSREAGLRHRPPQGTLSQAKLHLAALARSQRPATSAGIITRAPEGPGFLITLVRGPRWLTEEQPLLGAQRSTDFQHDRWSCP
jgi:hypothetical protein